MPFESRGFQISGIAKSGLSFTLSGLSFSVANLILANELAVEDYANFALLIAVVMIIASIGMLGADGVVNRRSVSADLKLFRRVALSSVFVASLGALFAIHVYETSIVLAALLIPTGVAFAMTRFCGAYLQSKHHFISSLLFNSSLNYLFLALALLVKFTDLEDLRVSFSVIAVLQCCAAAGALFYVRTLFKSKSKNQDYSWRESLAFIFFASSLGLLVQLERLLTPRLLELEDLAILGVLLAIVGPPFRLVQLTFGYDLLPKLRRINDRAEGLELVSKHAAVALAIMFPIWIVVWIGVPWVQSILLSDEYLMSDQLVFAALIAGTMKGFTGIAQSCVTALSSVRGLQVMGVVGWFSVLCAVLFASIGAQFGLAGILYGVAIGWAVRLAAAPVIISIWWDDGRGQADSSLVMQSLARPGTD